MKSLILHNLLAVTLFLSLNLNAQQERCATVQWNEYLQSINPEYLEYTLSSSNQELTVKEINKSATIVNIPVVVHVIWRLNEQNITDEQINSQIAVMNKDFNKLNWDTIKVPAVWKNIIGNCQINFVLANRDENGNNTAGITRKNTTTVDIATASGTTHCSDALGGTDAWDRDKYLNIWVCEIGGGVYGFSSMPGAPKACDGIVVDFGSFGTLGTAISPTDKGRTTTHELGHWLGLIHIWGDATCGTDLVNDTPVQEEPNYDCEFFPKISVPCNNGPDGDMFMNYMDYSDDHCMYMFTQGQVDRMNNTLNTIRQQLLTSPGWNGVGEIAILEPSISPNPANHVINIKATGSEKLMALELFDMKGTSLYHSAYNRAEQAVVDISNFPNGVYVLSTTTINGKAQNKIVIQHP